MSVPASHYKGMPDGETDPAKPGLVEFRVSIGNVVRALLDAWLPAGSFYFEPSGRSVY
ncbi:MAG: hypothetical protein WC521_08680 [Bdellovibrionales bacterium]|jgi:hypothetical protein